MADITITGSDVKLVLCWEKYPPLPADAAMSAGSLVRFATGSGQVTYANATSAAEARAAGILINTADFAGASVTVLKRGILDVGEALSSLDWDAALYVSNTDGHIGTAAGTTSQCIGRVVPGWGYTTADKLLLVDFDGSW